MKPWHEINSSLLHRKFIYFRLLMICSLNLARPKFYLIYKTELILVLFLYPPSPPSFWGSRGIICVSFKSKTQYKKIIVDFYLQKFIRITVINQLSYWSKRSKQTNKPNTITVIKIFSCKYPTQVSPCLESHPWLSTPYHSFFWQNILVLTGCLCIM